MALIDKETLYNLYVEQDKTQKQIADNLECSREAIKYYIKLYDIKKSKKLFYANVTKENREKMK